MAFIASTWSWISEMSGLKTTASPGQHTAGSWYTSDFPPVRKIGVRYKGLRVYETSSIYNYTEC